MDKERFEVQNAANTGEIAASRFKMLHIVRKMDRTGNPQKKQNEKNKPTQFQTHFKFLTTDCCSPASKDPSKLSLFDPRLQADKKKKKDPDAPKKPAGGAYGCWLAKCPGRPSSELTFSPNILPKPVFFFNYFFSECVSLFFFCFHMGLSK